MEWQTPGRLASLMLLASGMALADDEIFEIREFDTRGRVVTAQLSDFTGDGRADLMIATLEGIPPNETRTLHIYPQRSNGTFPDAPSHTLPIPRFSAVYDVADLKETPGNELVLLRPDGVSILSVGTEAGLQWNLPVSGPSTVAAGDDERGFDPFRLVYDDFGDEPLMLVPQIGAVTALTADGTELAQIDAGRRANYYVTKSSGLISVESEIQLFLDVPKLTVGDVDGDGLVDIVAATRHEIRVFLNDSESGFNRQPSFSLPLTFINETDHSRGTGSIVSTVRDIDDDGRLDLMISHIEGSFVDTVTTTYIYRNRDGRWDLDNPDDSYVSDGTLSSDLLLDVNSDGQLELVRIQFKFSVLEMVELLLTRKFDVRIAVYKLGEDGRYSDKPWSRKKISTAISFETFRPKGFMPTGGLDLNNDGRMDFVTSADGDGIEVYLGREDGPFTKRSALQKLDSAGVIRFADYDGDELADFVLYTPQAFDAPVRIGRNLGTLPRE
ncbi:MAG: VCBS repeat-containing protein [Woeseiaceae bacterium]|nr:VCBS repeat-containing protein [Woeseiaceae bacterium]